MKSTQKTADSCLRFANLCAEIAREYGEGGLGATLARESGDLVEHAGYIQALAQEAETTLNTDDSEEMADFRANWQMALNWWNKMAVAFTRLQTPETKDRMHVHMSEFWEM